LNGAYLRTRRALCIYAILATRSIFQATIKRINEIGIQATRIKISDAGVRCRGITQFYISVGRQEKVCKISAVIGKAKPDRHSHGNIIAAADLAGVGAGIDHCSLRAQVGICAGKGGIAGSEIAELRIGAENKEKQSTEKRKELFHLWSFLALIGKR
jgi:hypothetical protein